MPTKYFAIFCILLAVPLLSLVAVVSYCCFKVSVTAGIIAICITLGFAAAIIAFLAIKSKKH